MPSTAYNDHDNDDDATDDIIDDLLNGLADDIHYLDLLADYDDKHAAETPDDDHDRD